VAGSMAEQETKRSSGSPNPEGPGKIPPFALAEALEVVEGEASLLEEMAGVFLRLAPALLNEVQEAIESGDTLRAARNLRELEERAASVGAMAFLEETCSLQEALSNGGLSGLSSYLENLGILLEGYKEALAVVDWKDLGYGF